MRTKTSERPPERKRDQIRYHGDRIAAGTVPYYWMVCTLAQDPSKILSRPPVVAGPEGPTTPICLPQLALWHPIFGTASGGSLTTVGTVAVAALAAYGLAKIRFPGWNFSLLFPRRCCR